VDRRAGEKVSHSQNNEEALVLDAVADIPLGRFLDIGAHDGEMFSNTRQLATQGWGGVMVEPSPKPFTKLLALYADREDVIVVNAALTPGRAKLVSFWDSDGDGVSTTERDHMQLWSGQVKFNRFYLQTLPISDLLAQFPGPFHVVNIDTEKTSVDVFKAIPFDQLETRVVIVEHDQRMVEVATRGREFGFHIHDINGDNIILSR
jgi:FkbM family methyltransferase